MHVLCELLWVLALKMCQEEVWTAGLLKWGCLSQAITQKWLNMQQMKVKVVAFVSARTEEMLRDMLDYKTLPDLREKFSIF